MADTNSNDQFFRGNNTSPENKLWLNLTSDNGIFSQIAVGYMENATNAYDGMSYDAPRNLSSGAFSTIYSMIDGVDKKFAIQGKTLDSLDLDENIAIGFETSIDVATLYTLSIAQIKGDFLSTNTLYLRDNLMNIIHNVSESGYKFTSEPGEFNKRFEITFTNKSLSTEDQMTGDASVSIIELKNGEVLFKVSSPFVMDYIEIIDLLGRTLYKLRPNGNSNIYSLSNLNQGTYIAKVNFTNGIVITKKALKLN